MSERDFAGRTAADASTLLEAIMQNSSDPIFVKDREGHFLAVNSAGAKVFGRAPEEVVGKTNFDLAPSEMAQRIRAVEIEVIETGVTTYREELLMVGDEPQYFRTSRSVWRNSHGEVGGIVGVAANITDQRRREHDVALLAEAGRVLAESLDYRTTLNAVAQLVTPALADWCNVVVVNDQDRLETVAVAHADPDKVRWAHEVDERYPVPQSGSSGVPNVIRTGKSELFTNISDEMLALGAVDAKHHELLRQLQMRSVLIVPMSAHGRTLGALTLIGAESGRQFSERDLPLVEELARRSALAVVNSELFQAAASANRAKSEFLASMSHELRTPLNAIIGYSELLGEGISGPVTPGQQEQLLRVRASASHLLGLIDEVLSFSRMEAGHEQVAPGDVDVASLFADALALVRPMAEAKQLPLIIETAGADIRLYTDALKVRQILVNLLTNAVKFTDAGSVTLSARPDGDDVVFDVRDTGIGIAPANLASIFEPFWQVVQSASRRVGGTGLGLSVTRRLAHLLGGDVSVESTPGQGSTFVVRLPRDLRLEEQ
jgi:PAS domain S-box-containing protein